MEYRLTPAALRDLQRLPRVVQRRIYNKLNFYKMIIHAIGHRRDVYKKP